MITPPNPYNLNYIGPGMSLSHCTICVRKVTWQAATAINGFFSKRPPFTQVKHC